MTIFTADADRLVRALDTTQAFAGDDTTIPVLRCIRLERHGRYLLAAATNRFQIGCTRIEVDWADDAPVDWTHLLVRDDIALIVANYKGKNSRMRKITASAAATGGLTLSCTGSPVALTTEHQDVQFPNWRPLLAPTLEADEGGPAGLLDLAMLKTFDKARWSTSDHLRIKYAGRTDRLALVLCGHHFVGAQMPIREPDGQGEWAEILGGAE
ncbi:hypothetical protein [Rhodococcus sp. YH1]|uniref:hypothetical protein n=1 Tax=Rhodococcus sp. YH1 TaxID=89066 RepID=UPI001387553D|nr:hypothetical protein [Rhodococcus sp. YH1]